ncbi:ectoine hydroxylase [Thalassospira marina]|uniref:Ectoine hydroxylase n=1 Tax=Thalassospira marina TaxID=2048283 RepID=A0ABN5FL81_9PROT|nr:ectoine hydroxylase [Thalassospira marina]AUG52210.1 ectoine hydroxylase [Thalassospira marina]
MPNDISGDFPTDIYRSRKDSIPHIIDRADPVIWSDSGNSRVLSHEQQDFYEQNGYLFIENVFSADEIATLRREAEALRKAGETEEDVIREASSNAVRSVFRIHEKNQTYLNLMADDRLAAIAEHLLADDVYIHQSRVNFKPAFKGKEFYWHSDFETWHTEDGMPRMRALSMSITLSENTPYNGPLMLVPGSHKKFISCVGETPDDNYKNSLKAQEYGTPDQESLTAMIRKHGLAAPTGPAGSVLIFDCNTLHGSGNNITPFPRSNAFFVYNSMKNRVVAPFAAKSPRPDFLATRDNIRPIRSRPNIATARLHAAE